MKVRKEALFKGFSSSELEKRVSLLSFSIEVPGLDAFFFRLAWKKGRVEKIPLKEFSYFAVVHSTGTWYRKIPLCQAICSSQAQGRGEILSRPRCRGKVGL
ncbi:MAG: hypothetical protein ACUVTO_04035 [Candidatus Caldatribacteriaceae bacterium]